MRMLLLFPNIFIMSIAGYNLFSELGSDNKYYMPIALHATVVVISVIILSIIIRSAFKVNYVEDRD
jgi:hypothetical protein